MNTLDILFIGAVMNYDGTTGSLANYIRRNGKWVAPFQYIYEKQPQYFKSEADACVYDIPNLSICELVDYLKRRMDLKFHIVWHFDYHKEEILDILENSPPLLIAISSTLAFFPEYLKSAVRWLNQHKSPKTKIVVGGKWVYGNYNQLGATEKLERTLAEADADYYIINRYGQETLHQLLLAEKNENKGAAQNLPNLVYRRRHAIRQSKDTNCVYDGDQYRMNQVSNESHTPGKPMIDFQNIGSQFTGDMVHVQTASSCPFRCRFCTFPTLEGPYVLFDLEGVVRQLRQLKNMGVKYLFFIDDTFNVPLKRFSRLLDRMIEEKLDMEWVSFFRPQFATPEVVQKMYDAGCRMAFCGVESGNDGILKRMRKRVTVKQYEQGFEHLYRAGIVIAVSYFVGYPGETYETAMDTLHLINDPRIMFSRGGVFYYDPKAPVAERAEKWGLRGHGLEWRHNTMNSKEAAKIHLEILGKLKSVNVQISDGAGWSIFQLYGRGLDMDDIKNFYMEFNEIQRNQIQAAGKFAHHQYRVFGKKPRGRDTVVERSRDDMGVDMEKQHC